MGGHIQSYENILKSTIILCFFLPDSVSVVIGLQEEYISIRRLVFSQITLAMDRTLYMFRRDMKIINPFPPLSCLLQRARIPCDLLRGFCGGRHIRQRPRTGSGFEPDRERLEETPSRLLGRHRDVCRPVVRWNCGGAVQLRTEVLYHSDSRSQPRTHRVF